VAPGKIECRTGRTDADARPDNVSCRDRATADQGAKLGSYLMSAFGRQRLIGKHPRQSAAHPSYTILVLQVFKSMRPPWLRSLIVRRDSVALHAAAACRRSINDQILSSIRGQKWPDANVWACLARPLTRSSGISGWGSHTGRSAAHAPSNHGSMLRYGLLSSQQTKAIHAKFVKVLDYPTSCS
jgi:hypothetical protein